LHLDGGWIEEGAGRSEFRIAMRGITDADWSYCLSREERINDRWSDAHVGVWGEGNRISGLKRRKGVKKHR
jgi:hypothetical protein